MRTEQEIEEAALAAKGVGGVEFHSRNGLFYSFKDYFKYHDDECLKIKITIIPIESVNQCKTIILYKNTCKEGLEIAKKVILNKLYDITEIRVELVLSWNLGERAVFNIYTYDNIKNIFNASDDLVQSYYHNVGYNKDF